MRNVSPLLLVFLLSSVAGLLAIAPAAAQMAQNDSTVIQLDKVEVVASQKSPPLMPPQTLEGIMLKKLSGFNIADAMRYFSGVQIKDYGGVGGIKTVNIRSMGTHHVGIFYDGVELSNAQNGQIDLGQYSLDNMQRIELYNGQKASPLQPAKDFGASGTIYLDSRKPLFSDGAHTNFKATIKGGAFGLLNPSILVEQRLGNWGSMAVNGEIVRSHGRYPFRVKKVLPDASIAHDTTAIRHNGDISAARIEATLWDHTKLGTWRTKLYHYQSERGIPGAIVNNVWRRGERLWDNNSFVQTTLRHQPKEAPWSYNLLAKYAYYRTRYINRDPTTLMVDHLYKQQELYLSLAAAYRVGEAWHLSAAYDLQWNSLTGRMRGFHWPKRQTHLVAFASTYRNEWLSAQGSLLATLARDHVKELTHPPRHHHLSPAIMLAVRPFGGVDLTLTGFYKESFRLPTFNDLYYTEVGNSRLEPERTRQANLGASYTKIPRGSIVTHYSLKGDGYLNWVKNKIVAYPKGQQFRWTMLNLGEVFIAGIDLSGSLAMRPWRELIATIRAQYTYQHAIDVTNPRDIYYRHQIPYIPKHSGSANLQLTWREWQLNYSFIYAGERYNQQENILANYTPPWYTSDLGLGYSHAWKALTLHLMVECNNLLDQPYEVISGYPMPGRSLRLTLTVER